MNKEIWTTVDKYYEDLIVKPDPRLKHINQAASQAGLPTIQITPNQGAFLELLVRVIGAKRVLEIGTLGGYSTAWLARGLPPDGNLITLEINSEHAAVAQKSLVDFEFVNKIEFKIGDGLDSLKELVESGADSFDLIFIDAKKSQYSAYLDWSIKLSHPGTLIIADNVVRRGKVIDEFSDDTSIQGIRKFSQKVADHPRLKATVLQTVGAKGYDGFALLVVDPAS